MENSYKLKIGNKEFSLDENNNILLNGEIVSSNCVFNHLMNYLLEETNFIPMTKVALDNYVMETQVKDEAHKLMYNIMRMLNNQESNEEDFMNFGFVNDNILRAVYAKKADKELIKQLASNIYIRKHRVIQKNMFKNEYVGTSLSDIAKFADFDLTYWDIFVHLESNLGYTVPGFEFENKHWSDEDKTLFVETLVLLEMTTDVNAQRYINVIEKFLGEKAIFSKDEVDTLFIRDDVLDEVKDDKYDLKNRLFNMRIIYQNKLNFTSLYNEYITREANSNDYLELFTDKFKEEVLYEAILNKDSKNRWIYYQLIKEYNITENQLMIEALTYLRNNPNKLLDLYCDSIKDNLEENQVNQEDINRIKGV